MLAFDLVGAFAMGTLAPAVKGILNSPIKVLTAAHKGQVLLSAYANKNQLAEDAQRLVDANFIPLDVADEIWEQLKRFNPSVGLIF